MIAFTGVRAVLTDIEGTTTAISFVHEELFPYSRARMAGFCSSYAEDPTVKPLLDAVRGEDDLDLDGVVARLVSWIDQDRKVTELKALQGLIWQAGYADGSLRGHLYPDVTKVLRSWKARGLELHVYSSGSVRAQQLLYGHSVDGDLRPLFSGWYDTGVGHKRDPASYARIAERIGPPAGILFLSDVVEELDAARLAGMQTCWLQRDNAMPGDHPIVRSFDELSLS